MRPRRAPEAGVSLVEVLVVLVLIGVMAGAIGLSLGNRGAGAVAEREARVLVARLDRAADEALLAGEAMAVVWSASDYRLLRLRDGAWIASDVPLLAAPHVLPAGLRLLTDAEAGPYVVGPDLLPRSNVPLTLELRDDSGRGVRVTFDGATARLEEAA